MIPQILQSYTLKTLLLLAFPFSTVRQMLQLFITSQAWAEVASMQGEYCDMHHKVVPR